MAIHSYATMLAWSGSTGQGYRDDAEGQMDDRQSPVRLT